MGRKNTRKPNGGSSNVAETPDQKYRVGAYPLADEVFMFGERWTTLEKAMLEARNLPNEQKGAWCQPAYESLLSWAWPKLAEDPVFKGFYEDYQGRTLTPSEMMSVAREARHSWHRQNAWGTPQPRAFNVEDMMRK